MSKHRTALDEDLVGKVLLGRYRVVRELAKGGMGVVYLARVEGAVGFVKPVVIKLVLPDYAADDRFLSMFVREAQILAQLRHPGIVDVLELGEQDGVYVMVLEYVRGHHLGQWSHYLKLKGRCVPTDITIQIVIDVLDALHHAHEQKHPDGSPMNIVHRDVSPSNILLDEGGRARLVDFGVARMHGGNVEYKTQVRGFVGKLSYTAPEILNDVDASPQSDLYACAVVLHETILGRNVFRGETQAATLHRVVTHVPDWVASAREDIPDELDAVLRRALEKKPEDRFQSAHEFASALRELLHESETDIRRKLSELLRQDFSADLASLLKIESLAERDEAWRKLSVNPPPAGAGNEPSQTRPRRRANTEPPEAPTVAAVVTIGEPLSDAVDRTLKGMGTRARAQAQAHEPAQPDPPPARAAETARGARSAPEHTGMPKPAPFMALVPPAPVQSAGAAVPVAPPAAIMPATPGGARARRPLVLALIASLSIALAAIVLLLLRPSAKPAPVQRFRVVTEQSQDPVTSTPLAAVEPAAPTAPSAPEVLATAENAAEPEQELAPEAAAPKARARDRESRTRGPDAQSLTRAFRAEQPKIESCFRTHAASLAGRPKIQVEFSLTAAGKVSQVAVTPAALSTTPLGACIAKVARGTRFPGQGEPVSFAIPVTATQTAPSR